MDTKTIQQLYKPKGCQSSDKALEVNKFVGNWDVANSNPNYILKRMEHFKLKDITLNMTDSAYALL